MLPRMISPPILPQDIISRVLEKFLFDDTPTLQTCALVARSFLISSQKCLFHTIHLDHLEKAQQHCQKLHPILLNNPTLLTYVRGLFVFGGPERWICTEETFHAILNMLPHLRFLSIQFRYVAWYRLPAEFKKALERVFTLPSLVVCKIQGMRDFPTEFFRALKHLKELSLQDTSVTVEPDMICATTNLKKIQSLECLTLTGVRMDENATLEAMRVSIDMSHLRKVYVHSWTLRWVWEATKDSADSLDVLEWYSFLRPRTFFFDAGEMDLTAFKELRVLHLATELSIAVKLIKWLVRSLEPMSRASNLEEITICLEMYGGLHDSEDESVSDVLLDVAEYLWDFNIFLTASGNFPKLAKLVLYICVNPVYNQEILELLHDHIPGLSTGTHGILRVIPTVMSLGELFASS